MHGECDHTCSHQATPYTQSLDELEFERGIWQAAIDGDKQKVTQLLEKGTDVDIPDNSGYTALHYSCRNNHPSLVTYLLQKGACVNAQTKSGRDTPLHRASYAGHQDIVSTLLQHGANILMTNADGQTAFHRACVAGRTEVVKLMIRHEPKIVHVQDLRGRTGVDLCSDKEIVKLLAT